MGRELQVGIRRMVRIPEFQTHFTSVPMNDETAIPIEELQHCMVSFTSKRVGVERDTTFMRTIVKRLYVTNLLACLYTSPFVVGILNDRRQTTDDTRTDLFSDVLSTGVLQKTEYCETLT